MNHLDNTTLNLYLDDALDARARAAADAHLAACPVCAGELDALRALSGVFANWHAESIPHDLSVQVMQRVAQRPAPAIVSRWGTLLLGAQVLMAVALVIWLLPTLSQLFTRLTNIPAPSFTWDFFSDVSNWGETFSILLPAWSGWVWGVLLAGGIVIWFIVNRLIFDSLNHTPEASQ